MGMIDAALATLLSGLIVVTLAAIAVITVVYLLKNPPARTTTESGAIREAAQAASARNPEKLPAELDSAITALLRARDARDDVALDQAIHRIRESILAEEARARAEPTGPQVLANDTDAGKPASDETRSERSINLRS
jgi:hypothetical protein